MCFAWLGELVTALLCISFHKPAGLFENDAAGAGAVSVMRNAMSLAPFRVSPASVHTDVDVTGIGDDVENSRAFLRLCDHGGDLERHADGAEAVAHVGVDGEFTTMRLLFAQTEEAFDGRAAMYATYPVAFCTPCELRSSRSIGQRSASTQQSFYVHAVIGSFDFSLYVHGLYLFCAAIWPVWCLVNFLQLFEGSL